MTVSNPGSVGLSDFWRYDRSEDLVREMVSVLQGASTLIGNMGGNLRVVWSGGGASYTDFHKGIVALDYGPLKDRECPFPGAAVDEVIGYAAHEGGHCLWTPQCREQAIVRGIQASWSYLPQALQADWQGEQRGTLRELCLIQNILEDAYVDRRIAQRWPILGKYVHIAREGLKARAAVDPETLASNGCPDRSAVISLWVSLSLYGYQMPQRMAAGVSQALETLLDLSRKAAAEENDESRQALAVPAAIILWQRFPRGKEQHHDGTCQRGLSAVEPIAKPGDFDPAGGLEGRSVVPLPRPLWDAVSAAVAGQEDLSQSVARDLGEDASEVVARARRADYDPELARSVLSQVDGEAREIRRAIPLQHGGNSRWRHGLSQGSLDDRRLWKAWVGDPACYRRKQVDRSLAVGLLLDASGSMKKHMAIVESTAAAFSQGLLLMPGVNFVAWCYTGQSGQVALVQVCDRHRLCLGGVEWGGGTPSGAAIAAAKALMQQQRERRKLLVHFTDGEPDSPAHVIQAVNACRGAGIQVHAIGLPQHERMLCGQYGAGNYETIQALPELPQAVSRIVTKLIVPRG